MFVREKKICETNKIHVMNAKLSKVGESLCQQSIGNKKLAHRYLFLKLALCFRKLIVNNRFS